jgi:heterodisulfide reductase subunit B2
MKSYTYFPGCSSADGTAVGYNQSIQVIIGKLEIELDELEDWNCCGSTPYYSTDELGSLCVAARNLALAEKFERDVVTPCSSCYTILNRVNEQRKMYPELKKKMDECLAAAGLKYSGGVRVRHLFEAIYTDIGLEKIAAKVTRPLKGLKVAPYYGCQMIRPESSFDDLDNPRTMEKFIASLGAEPTEFRLKDRCCGSSMLIPELDMTLGLHYKLLESAKAGGAQCIITVCPLCQTALDAYQTLVGKKFGTSYNLPVLFFSQLMGIAMGVDPKKLGLEKNIVPANKVFAAFDKAAEPVAQAKGEK